MCRLSVTAAITSATAPMTKASSAPRTARLRIEPPRDHREREDLEHGHPPDYEPGRELPGAIAQQGERGRHRHPRDRHQPQQVAPLDPEAGLERDQLAVLA